MKIKLTDIDAALRETPPIAGNAGKILAVNGQANGLEWKADAGLLDAPSDEKQYARKNGSWAEVVGGSGPGGGEGGVTAPSIQTAMMAAIATAYDGAYTTDHSIDQRVQVGDFYGLIFTAYTNQGPGNPKVAVNARLTVPTGKRAVVLKYSWQRNSYSDTSYYRHNLYNETTQSVSAGTDAPSGRMAPQGDVWPDQAFGDLGQMPVRAAEAGETISVRASSSGDGTARTIAGYYIVALIDAVTGEMDTGENGSVGPAGPVGPGVPVGGDTGQILTKLSDDDLDTAWVDPAPGGLPPIEQIIYSKDWRVVNQGNNGNALWGFAEIKAFNRENVNITDTATVSASSVYAGVFPASYGVDNNLGTQYYSDSNEGVSGAQFYFAFPAEVALGSISIQNGGSNDTSTACPRDFQIQYKVGSEWHVAATVTNQTNWTANQIRTFPIAIDTIEVVIPSLIGAKGKSLSVNPTENGLVWSKAPGGFDWFVNAVGTGEEQEISIPYPNLESWQVMMFKEGIKIKSSDYNIVGDKLIYSTNSGDELEIFGPAIVLDGAYSTGWRLYCTTIDGSTALASIAELYLYTGNEAVPNDIATTGTPSQSTQYAGFAPENFLDRNAGSFSSLNSPPATYLPGWWQVSFPSTKKIIGFGVLGRQSELNNTPKDFQLQYYDLATETWVPLINVTGQTGWDASKRDFFL